MAKSSSSKVIFVPMQLQSDVIGQMAGGLGNPSNASGGGEMRDGGGTDGIGGASRAALLNSVSQI